MIESILIKNVATYDISGIQIKDLKKINFFYGGNGTGKTTISNFLQNQNNEKFRDCSLQWKNEQELTTLVYNKEFREQNFGKGKINGIFTLGQATKEEIKVIEDKTEELKNIRTEIVQKQETIKSQTQKKKLLEDESKESFWIKIYKEYENVFKEAFTGFLSKERFKDKLLQEFRQNGASLLNLDELKKKAGTIFGEQPQNISPINIIPYTRIVEIENNVIWKKIIIGKSDVDIAKLIQKININDWVDQGRSYLREGDNTCPFCQQKTITEDFKKQLENFFDQTYINDINSIKQSSQEYSALIQNLIHELNLIENNQKNFKDTKLNIDKYSSYLKTLISQVSNNGELMNNKIKEPSRSVELISLKEQLDLIFELIKEANAEIKTHNDIVTNYTGERTYLINSIWKFIIEKFKTDINKFNTDYNGLELGITTLQNQLNTKLNEYKTLDTEIKKLSKDITSIQPTIDEINRLLESYNFLNFKIVPAQENGFYQIQREDGDTAEHTLSEGEITFITFLYFLQRAKGGNSKETVHEERILVIDDPISSLDSNVLFVVSTLIKEIIKSLKNDQGNIKQVILLTHNVYFHKEVSFIDDRSNKCNQTNYWILRKNEKTTELQHFLMDNPIQSSYSLLWQELKRDSIKSGIAIQNTMRRIIENYFRLLGKYSYNDLITQFQTKEDQEICRSLISWINDGSHGVNDDLYIELQDRTIESYKEVFKKIFILTNHEGHYNMMMDS